MPTYRVFGEMTKTYYMDVQADEILEAYDIANQRDTIDWFEIETDGIIEVFDAEEYDQELGEPASGQLL
jgi:hypothetical protein